MKSPLRVLVIDNYDSFTYNLVQYIEGLGASCIVRRNDMVSLREIEELAPGRIVISPGPGNPDSAGITLSAIRAFAGKIPLLGVCLGHQAIGQVFGGQVVRAPAPRHGKISIVTHEKNGVFEGLPSPLRVARYHSLVVDRKTLPSCLKITAQSEDGLIMGLKHVQHPVFGVQFHPESIATERGPDLIANFLEVPSGNSGGSKKSP